MSSECHFALCVGGPYARGGAVVVGALARTFQRDTPLSVWVFHSGLGPEDRALYEAAAGLKRGREAVVRFVPLPPEVIRLPVQSDYITSETFGRLALPRLLPPTVPRVVYLDADLMILKDLSELYTWNLSGACLAAVREPSDPFFWSRNGLEHAFELGLDPNSPYFNAGVLVMDLAALRARKMEERCLEYVARHRPARMDQDALNAIFLGAISELPTQWNVENYFFKTAAQRHRYRTILKDARILHYTGHKKPWNHDVWQGDAWRKLLERLMRKAGVRDVLVP
ncbi:glycosyltransferase family 8 protein [Streptomyces buecherae]|uniref:Glycosyltransferase family 8 protein n=1 Tax=Streptomyces buecherae TaxID=2763006 RepID=A0A7H8NHU6_9ACTN|nr:glycosyltransferase family 8 protein [Streptomyces buecherae]QKW48221.1 glycosyltransferase family 8 protein [Streptomyces buecherae]QKW54109.1 glycosyltransferase family 8 protein [Streptomyces buecherae]